MHAICARLRLISHIIRCPGYIQSVPAGENYLGSFGEISPQMLPCVLRKHSRAVRHKASLAHGWRCGDGHRRFPAARRGGWWQGRGGAISGGVLSICSWWGLKARSFWSFPRRSLCSTGCVLERAGFVVVLALFYVKTEKAKSIGWKFL